MKSALLITLATLSAIAAQLADSDITQALQALNTARDAVSAGALFQLQWSTYLQQAAQQYAVGSTSQQPPTYVVTNQVSGLPYQNSWYSGSAGSFQGAVDAWVQQGSTYDAATGTCTSANCNNYQAMIYAYSTEVGCGVNSDSTVFVCFYSIPNLYNTLPYTPATVQGSDCESADTNNYCTNPYSTSGASDWISGINTHRNAVSPAPTDMNQVQWDDTVALYAQSLVEQCIQFAPDTIGSYASTYYSAPVAQATTTSSVISAWYNEYKNYDYTSNTYTSTYGYQSNYTQMVYQSVNTTACAHKTCTFTNGQYDIYVCLYDAAYNTQLQPYSSADVSITTAATATSIPQSTANNTAASDFTVNATSVFNDNSDEGNWLYQINTNRQAVTPAPASMNTLTWSTTLANLAQTYATQCSEVNTPTQSFPAGVIYYDNVISGSGSISIDIQSVVSYWYNEGKLYTYSSNTCATSTTPCTDYLQLVYANATQVGCGAASCNTDSGPFLRYTCMFDQAYSNTTQPYVAKTDTIVTTTSSAAILGSPNTNATVLTNLQQQQLITQINTNRSSLVPQAANMRFIAYNTTLSTYAANIIGYCNALSVGTSTEINGVYGSTISITAAGQYTLANVVENWFLQKGNYDYTTNKISNFASSYLQLVNAETDQVGCAYDSCSGNDVYVCLYNYPFSSAGVPYVSGTPCSTTTNVCTKYYSDTTVCTNGLCGTTTNNFAAVQSSTTTTSTSNSSSSSSGLTGGDDAGIAIGVVAGVALLGGLCYCCILRQRGKRTNRLDSEHYTGDEYYHGGEPI